MATVEITAAQIDHASSDPLSRHDYAILNEVEGSLARGLQLKAWWDQTKAGGPGAKRFPTALTFNHPDFSFAFFGHAPVDGQTLPVLGDFQDLYFDRPKSPSVLTRAAADWLRRQIQEFALRYFARISSSDLPKAFEPGAPSPPAPLNPFGLCPGKNIEKEGFGQTQLYYKLRESGLIGKFPESQRSAIVDMREIGTKYEWIVGDARMFGFNVSIVPFGSHLPYFEVPLQEGQLGVISRELITNNDDPQAGVLGEYGYGLATIKNTSYHTLVGYGPGYFDEGFMTFTWRVLAEGSIRVRLVFVANQPEHIVNPALDPINWVLKVADTASFGLSSRLLTPVQNAFNQLPLAVKSALIDPVFGALALTNLLTFDQAAQQLCLSRRDVQKLFLFYHFTAIYTLITNSVLTWRQIPNWLNPDDLPAWVVHGTGSQPESVRSGQNSHGHRQ